MTAAPTADQDGSRLPGLRRMRRLATAVLLFERLWPAVAPALGAACVFICVALLDLPHELPPILHLVVLIGLGIVMLILLGIGLREVRRPLPAETDRRLEADSGLRHQPLAVLADHPATGGNSLWAAHVARARAQIGRLKLKAPRPMLAAADPRALRALVLVALVACVGIAGPDALPRLERAFHPGFVPTPPPPAPLLQAWITPPAYTGQAPVFLKAEGGGVTVPAGARLSVNVTGGTATGVGGEPILEQSGHTQAFRTLDPTSFQIEQDLTTGGRLAVRRRGREMAAWDLTVVEDSAPVVTFPEPPGFVRNGTNPQTRLPWQVSHPYGVTSLQAELHLADRSSAPPLILPIPMPGNAPKSAKGARVQDLTAHPWAGLKVTAQLAARDAPGREGRSETMSFILPSRRFNNPVARAIIAARRQLSLNPEARAPVVETLDQLSGLSGVWDDDSSGFVNLRAIASLLYRGRDADTVPEAQSRMWDLALHLEEGAPERTARALDAARQQLRDALEAEKRGETMDRADLDRRMKELQDALQKRLDALTEQARRDPQSDAYNPEDHPIDQRNMQRLAQEMRDAARKGDDQTAREKMAELDRMMEAMKDARPEHGQMTQRERQRAEKRQRGQQQMSALQDIIQREGNLLDKAQMRASDQADALRRLQPKSNDATSADQAQRATDQKIQLALRRAIGELMQQYADLTGNVPPNLGDADTAMRDGAQALGQGQDTPASQAAQRAIEALQKGGQSMSQQMARQFGRSQQQGGQDADEGDEGEDGQGMAEGEGDGEGDGPGRGSRQFGDQQGRQPGSNNGLASGRQHANRPGQQRDPLGRPRGEGTAGTDQAGDVQVPEKMEEARTRELQEELRRRGSDRTRSQQELDYIDRLLKQF